MRPWIVLVLMSGFILGALEVASNVASPDPLAIERTASGRFTPDSRRTRRPLVEPEPELPRAGARHPIAEPTRPPAEAPSVEPSFDGLLESLREALREKDMKERKRILAEIRDRLATPDPQTDRAVAEATWARDDAALYLKSLINSHPDKMRRRVLRSHIAEAAPPAPTALPPLTDSHGVASFLAGPRSDADKTWLLERLDRTVLATSEVQSSLVDLVLRTTEDSRLARSAMSRLRYGPREATEQLAIRITHDAPTIASRRSSVRLLGSVAGPAGVDRLVGILRDESDLIMRRLAAIELRGKKLDEVAIASLRACALDRTEDKVLRLSSLNALRLAAVGKGARGALAAAATKSVEDAIGSARPSDIDATITNDVQNGAAR